MSFETPNTPTSASSFEAENSPEARGRIKIMNLVGDIFTDEKIRREWVFNNCLSQVEQGEVSEEELDSNFIDEKLKELSENIEVNPITGTLEDYSNRLEQELNDIDNVNDKVAFVAALADFRRGSLIQDKINTKLNRSERLSREKRPGQMEAGLEFTGQDDLAVRAFIFREVSDRSLMNNFLKQRFGFYKRYEEASGHSVLAGFKDDFERILDKDVLEGDKNDNIRERQLLTKMSLLDLGWEVNELDDGKVLLNPSEAGG